MLLEEDMLKNMTSHVENIQQKINQEINYLNLSFFKRLFITHSFSQENLEKEIELIKLYYNYFTSSYRVATKEQKKQIEKNMQNVDDAYKIYLQKKREY